MTQVSERIKQQLVSMDQDRNFEMSERDVWTIIQLLDSYDEKFSFIIKCIRNEEPKNAVNMMRRRLGV